MSRIAKPMYFQVRMKKIVHSAMVGVGEPVAAARSPRPMASSIALTPPFGCSSSFHERPAMTSAST